MQLRCMRLEQSLLLRVGQIFWIYACADHIGQMRNRSSPYQADASTARTNGRACGGVFRPVNVSGHGDHPDGRDATTKSYVLVTNIGSLNAFGM